MKVMRWLHARSKDVAVGLLAMKITTSVFKEHYMSKLKLDIIGVGLIGKTHIKAALEIPDFDLVGVADSDPAALPSANQYGLKSYTSHRDLLEGVKPDAVIVAIPNKLHVPFSIDCLRAGAHILVEKPIA
jgi:predicted dehydrogenase